MGSSGLVLEIFLLVAVLAVAIMVGFANYRVHDELAANIVTARGYAIRRYWFWFLTSGAIIIFVLTIPYFPYPHARADRIAKHYPVLAQQYSFTMPAEIPLNTPIVFDVTSRDVNHGFGIYGPDGQVLSQVQAMPDYVNHLPMTFTVPGRAT